MKFLLISESAIDAEQYFKMYIGDYIETVPDVIVRYKVEDAKTVIAEELIEKQKHLDFIIADFHSDEFYKEYLELARWIRQQYFTYSSRNFKLAAIPMFLMNNSMNMARHFYSSLQEQIDSVFDGIVYKPDGYKRIGTSNNPLAKGLDYWLDKLKSDIDDLDLDANSNFNKVDARILKSRLYKLRVLSSSFIENNKPLNYLWVGNNLKIVESAGDKLIKLLKTYNQNPSLRNEKDIHEFLKTYHHLLKTEDYRQSIYEQHFYHKNSKSYEEVDFINITHTYSLMRHELFEVKLPNQRFYSRKTLNILKPAQKYFCQIGNKYFSYFSSQTNLEEIREKANKHNVTIKDLDFKYSLLMGRDEDKQQNLAGLNSFTSTLKGDVKLLTYDDLLKRHHYLHLRVTRFGI